MFFHNIVYKTSVIHYIGGIIVFKAKPKNNVTKQGQQDIHILVEELEAIKSGQQKKLSHVYKDIDQNLQERLNMVACSNCPSHNTFIRQVNQLLQTLMKMDFVRSMIHEADEQANMVETIAATSEEMAANIEDIASFVRNALVSAHDSNSKSVHSKELMDISMIAIENSFKETEVAKEQIIRVNEQTEKIDEMVNIIMSVAAQTNLLALNASIEAARAGNSGKGFAVVANEIKKLADHTKESVSFIQESVHSLRTQIQGSTSAIEKASKSFLKGKETLAQVLDAIEEVEQSSKTIETNMEQINMNIEQQTASSEEVSSSIQIINEKTKSLHEDSIRTGQGFFTVSLEIDDLRKNIIHKATNIEMYDSLDLVITDSLNWRWCVYNMILGNAQVDIALVANADNSRLGRWITNFGSKESILRNHISLLEKPRYKMHELAQKALESYNHGDKKSAEDYLSQVDRLALEIDNILREMQSKYKK